MSGVGLRASCAVALAVLVACAGVRGGERAGPLERRAAEASAEDGRGDGGARDPLDAVVLLTNARGAACSGVVVGERHVLTAQHCLPVREVVVGRSADAARQRIVVRWAVTRTPRLDVALLILRERVDVEAVRVAAEDAPFPRTVRLAGYGANDASGTGTAGVRRDWEVELRGWGCDRRRELVTGCSGDVEAVIPRGAGRDTCRGDSGGPVLERTEDGWRVIAVTSRGVGNALLTCGDGGIYVRVDRIADWLRAQLATRVEERG